MNQYRLLKVKEVRDEGDALGVWFEDSCFSMSYPKTFFAEKGLADINPGQEVFLKGKIGNEDFALAGFELVADMRPA